MIYNFLFALAISSFLLGCATSHKAITTQRAIEDLYERQGQLEAKIDKISEDMKALRGDIQPLNRAIEQSYSKLEKRIENLEKRKTSRGYQSAASANSLYSTAESYYRDKQFKEAILAYQRFIANYPRDKRVPLSYLKQGLSLISIGKKDEAKYFFQTLIDKFPNSEEAKAAQEKLRQIDQSS